MISSDEDSGDLEGSLAALSTNRVERWYLKEWASLSVRDGMPSPDHEELRLSASLIGTHVAADGARADALTRLDADAWSQAVAQMHEVIGDGRRPVLDVAIENVALSLMASVTPAEAADDQPWSSLESVPDTPPYLFLSSLDSWIRLLAIRALIDSRRQAGLNVNAENAQLIRRGRPIVVRLLEEIATLPPMQRYAITLSAWRSDRRWLKEILLDLARGARLTIPIDELFPLDVDQSVNSDREIAAYLSGQGQTGKAGNVAANRSIARGKLVAANPMYGPLLSSLLPYRKSSSGATVVPPVDDKNLAHALEEAADTGARAFEVLLEGSCPRYQPLLPEFLRASGGDVSNPSRHLAWRSVRAHVVACGRCRTIFSERLLPSKRGTQPGHTSLVRPLSTSVERVAVELFRRRVGDRRMLLRLLTGLTEQAELRPETLQALEDMAEAGRGRAEHSPQDDYLTLRAVDALAAWRKHHPVEVSADESLNLPLALEASVTHSTRARVLISGASGVWGSLEPDVDGMCVHLAGLPRALNGKSPQLMLRYRDPQTSDLGLPRPYKKKIERGELKMTWEGLEERHLRRIVGLTILPPAPSKAHYKIAGNSLAAKGRKAREEGQPMKALSYCNRELALLSTLKPTAHYAMTERRTGAICLELGRLDEAALHMQKALEVAQEKEIQERRVICDAQRGLGEIETRRANLKAADVHLTEALDLARRLGSEDRVEPTDRALRVASILTSRAGLLLDQGSESEALTVLEEALEMFDEYDDKVGSAAALNTRALVQRRIGAHGEAFQTCKKARELLSMADGGVRARRLEAELMCTEGRLHHAEGNTNEAMRCFWESLEQMYRVGHRGGEGDAIAVIGRVYEALGDIDAALRSFQRARDIFTDTGDRFRRSAILGTLARVHLSKAQRSAGELRAKLMEMARDEAMESFEGRKTDRGRAITATILASIYVEWSRDDSLHQKEARGWYEQAIDLRRLAGDGRGLAITFSNLAEFELMLGEYGAAGGDLEEALECFRLSPNPRAEAVAMGLLADVREALSETGFAQQARWRAIDLVERVRAGIGDHDLRRHYFATSAKHYRELARMLALDSPREAVILTEASRGRTLLERAMRAERPISYSGESENPWRDGITAVEGLDSTTVTLSYLISEKASFVFLIRSNEVVATPLDVSPRRLRRQTEKLIEAVGSGSVSYPYGRVLCQALIDPVMDRLDGCTRLIISPDEPISHLPFELLLTSEAALAANGAYRWGEDMPYLLRQAAIETVPTLALRGLPHTNRHSSELTVLAPALSQAQQRWLGAWQTHPPAEGATDGWLRLVAGHEATAKVARGIVNTPTGGVLLVIADSLIEDDRALLTTPTALIFGDDEPLVADEIASLQSSADLVVLSADGAANGPFVPGEGPLSLAAAFLTAGARTVCAPTLPVPAGAEVLPLMLGKVASGLDPAEAMREAQLAASDGGSHPLHWAGWKVMGSG